MGVIGCWVISPFFLSIVSMAGVLCTMVSYIHMEKCSNLLTRVGSLPLANYLLPYMYINIFTYECITYHHVCTRHTSSALTCCDPRLQTIRPDPGFKTTPLQSPSSSAEPAFRHPGSWCTTLVCQAGGCPSTSRLHGSCLIERKSSQGLANMAVKCAIACSALTRYVSAHRSNKTIKTRY